MNIVKNFPRAEEIRELTPNGLQLYDFEQKLKSLRKRILTAAVDGETEVKISNICDEIKSFLSEKGYVVTKKHDNLYIISWIKNKSNLSPVNINVNIDKKNFQTGGVVSYNTLTEDNKYCNCCTNGIMDENTFNQLKEKWKNLCSKNLTF